VPAAAPEKLSFNHPPNGFSDERDMAGERKTGQVISKIRDFAESHEYIAAALFFVILLIIVFGNVVFFGATLTTSALMPGTLAMGPYEAPPRAYLTMIDPGASAWQQEPEYVFASEQIKAGIFPLWNPYSGFGTPFLGEFITALLYPPNFLVYFAPAAFTWSIVNALILLKLFIAGFFTYCFLREIGVSKYGSLVSGVGFMLTGYFILYINMMHLNTEVLIPVLLFVFERQIKTGHFAYAIAGAAVIAIAVFGGMPESVLYLLFFAVLYYLYRVFLSYYGSRRPGDLVRPLLLLVVAVGGGILLSAVQILPFVEFWGVSWNRHAPVSHVLPFRFETITLLVPYFFGWIHSNWNNWTQHRVLPYIGIFVSYFALLAFSRKNRFLQYGIFFGAAVVFFLLKVYGVFLVNWIDALPLFNVSIFPKYFFPEFAFCMAVLAGIGASSIETITKKRIYIQTLGFSAVIVIFLLANLPGILASEWVAQAYGIVEDAVSWVSIMVAFAFIVLGVITFLLLAHRGGWLSRSRLETVLLAVLLLELFIYAPHIQGPRIDPFNTPPYIDFLKNDSDVYRVVGFDHILYPNTATAYRIADIRELDPVMVSRYMVFLQGVMGLPPATRFDGLYQDINFRSLDMMNVKYVLSSSDLGSIARGNMVDEIIRDGVLTRRGNIGRIFTSTINGKFALVVSAPTRIDYAFAVPDNAENFIISAGMQPGSWNRAGSDGVNFTVRIVSAGGDREVFTHTLDPAHNREDREWFTRTIDLSQYRGQTVHLLLITDTRGNPAGDEGAAWGDPGLETSETLRKISELEQQLTEVYNNEIIIYENRNVIPRAWFVTNATFMDSDREVLRELGNATFDAEDRVLLFSGDVPPGYLPELTGDGPGSGNSSVEIVSYGTERLEFAVHAERPGILVVSDVYYPGWNAYADGNATAIFPADYAFRGVYLGPGDHTVTMKYEPGSFRNGIIVSLAAAVALGVWFVLFRKFRK
jgi:hypothetical protein